MELGLIGLGKMGFNMATRLRQGGQTVVGFDFNADVVKKLSSDGSKGVDSLEALVKSLKTPRAIWLMVPSGDPVDETIAKLEPLMEKGDILSMAATRTIRTLSGARRRRRRRASTSLTAGPRAGCGA